MRRLRRLLTKRSTRRAERVFVAEGVELLRTAVAAGAPVESVYVAAGRSGAPDVAEVTGQALAVGARIFELAPGVLEKVADTVTPQPVLAVVGMGDVGLASVGVRDLVVVCADVRDPGNAGTVLRSADAAGVGAVLCCGGTVDPYNPKTVRSSAGSIFHVPLVVGTGTVEALATLADSGYRRLGAVAQGGDDYAALDWRRPTALVLGNESGGLPATVVEALDGTVGIPMAGRAESLNVGVACAVLCFEALRQRRAAGPTMRPMAEPVEQ